MTRTGVYLAATLCLSAFGCSDEPLTVPELVGDGPPEIGGPPYDGPAEFDNPCTQIQRKQSWCMGYDPDDPALLGFVQVPNEECLEDSADYRESFCMDELGCEALVQGVAWAECHGKV